VKAFKTSIPMNFALLRLRRLNQQGLHIKSFRKGEESVCHYTLGTHYSGGVPDSLTGGLSPHWSIAQLRHRGGSEMACRGLVPGDVPSYRYVSVSLKVDFLKPTPTGKVLELRGRVKEMKARKAVVTVTLSAEGEIRAKGEVVLYRLLQATLK